MLMMMMMLIFYARQLYRQVLLRARISYGDSVCPSVWGVTTRCRTKPRWDRDSGSNLARELLQIDTDLLRIITSTADELLGGTNIDNLDRP